MSRVIPGTVQVSGRNFKYVQAINKKEFEYQFPKITSYGMSEMPKSGGMISENTEILLPDGTLMFGVSYKGDLNGWENKIKDFCATLNLLHGEICVASLILSDGKIVSLSKCSICFY